MYVWVCVHARVHSTYYIASLPSIRVLHMGTYVCMIYVCMYVCVCAYAYVSARTRVYTLHTQYRSSILSIQKIFVCMHASMYVCLYV